THAHHLYVQKGFASEAVRTGSSRSCPSGSIGRHFTNTERQSPYTARDMEQQSASSGAIRAPFRVQNYCQLRRRMESKRKRDILFCRKVLILKAGGVGRWRPFSVAVGSPMKISYENLSYENLSLVRGHTYSNGVARRWLGW